MSVIMNTEDEDIIKQLLFNGDARQDPATHRQKPGHSLDVVNAVGKNEGPSRVMTEKVVGVKVLLQW